MRLVSQVWLVSRVLQASQVRLVPLVSQLSQVLMVSQAFLVSQECWYHGCGCCRACHRCGR